MSTTRRDFLKKGTIVALAASVPLSLSAKSEAADMLTNPSDMQLGKEAFTANLNTYFLINHGGMKIKTKLVEVFDLRDSAQPKPQPGREGFSLLFQGERTHTLRQNTYIIQHDNLGRFAMLLVPIVRKDKSAHYYEAVVNRLYP